MSSRNEGFRTIVAKRHSLINCPKRAKETTSSAPFVAATNTARVEDCEEGFIESVNEEVEKVQEKGSLWSRLKEMKEASTSKAKSSMVDLKDASIEDEVFLPEDYSNGRGFNLMKNYIDCNDNIGSMVWETLYQKQTGSCKNGRLGSCKSARRIPKGLIHVQASFNNTIVTVIEVRGRVVPPILMDSWDKKRDTI
ncbi:ribosomal protein S11 [Tanacetum coccineum]|uniref:Ribosomal protein S11 n=1 Tax=Tanacetum coccineum TaxID=301880 RepID=A0ABQ5F7X3_9ASTR